MCTCQLVHVWATKTCLHGNQHTGIVGGPVSETEQLRSWFSKEVEGYGLMVRDLGPISFADGLVLCAVLHRYLPQHM